MKRTNSAQWMENQNRWQINVQKNGKRRSFYSSIPGRKGQRECNAKADAWLDDGIENVNLRISVLFDQYTSSLKDGEDRDKAISIGKCYIKPAIGFRRIKDVDEDDFQCIIDDAAQCGVKGAPLSWRSLCNIKTQCKAFMKYCRRKKVTKETLEFLEIPKWAEKREKRILQPKDLAVLFTVDTTIYRGKREEDDYIHAYRLAVLSGLRPGELAGLEWDDISDKRIRIQRSLNDRGEITRGKNDNARRQFILTDLAKAELDAQLDLYSGKRVFDIRSQSTYRHHWRRYCESNGLPYISPYEMRHTFVSMAKSLPEGELRTLVGHSKNMDTWGVYSHCVEGEQEQIASKLETIFQDLLAENEL